MWSKIDTIGGKWNGEILQVLNSLDTSYTHFQYLHKNTKEITSWLLIINI